MTAEAIEVEPDKQSAPKAFLAVEDLRVHFPTDDGLVKSVDGLSFEVERGQILGIVGESGSGKSVTSQAILGLHKGSRAKDHRRGLARRPGTRRRQRGGHARSCAATRWR